MEQFTNEEYHDMIDNINRGAKEIQLLIEKGYSKMNDKMKFSNTVDLAKFILENGIIYNELGQSLYFDKNIGVFMFKPKINEAYECHCLDDGLEYEWSSTEPIHPFDVVWIHDEYKSTQVVCGAKGFYYAVDDEGSVILVNATNKQFKFIKCEDSEISSNMVEFRKHCKTLFEEK